MGLTKYIIVYFHLYGGVVFGSKFFIHFPMTTRIKENALVYHFKTKEMLEKNYIALEKKKKKKCVYIIPMG